MVDKTRRYEHRPEEPAVLYSRYQHVKGLDLGDVIAERNY